MTRVIDGHYNRQKISHLTLENFILSFFSIGIIETFRTANRISTENFAREILQNLQVKKGKIIWKFTLGISLYKFSSYYICKIFCIFNGYDILILLNRIE